MVCKWYCSSAIMDLRINDIITLLNVPEKTVNKWIKDNFIPFHVINHEYRFNITEVKEWVLQNRLPLTQEFLKLTATGIPMKLSELVTRGGIIYDIPGSTMADVLKASVKAMTLPEGTHADSILFSLLEREELLPTAVGNGIAIPHPRNPLVTDITHEQVTLVYLNEHIEYHAPDKLPIHVLFILLSANHRRHLEILARLAFFCQDRTFLRMLDGHPHDESIIAFMKEHE